MVWLRWCVYGLVLLAPFEISSQVAPPPPDLVERARSARFGDASGIGRYRVTVLERLSAYIALPLLDRLAFRREIEATLSWRHDGPDTVTVLGARRFRPSLGNEVAVLEGIESEAIDVTFNPDRDRRSIGLGSFRLGVHPLLPGAELWYRFELGDTVTLGLPTGRRIRIAEVSVAPVSESAQVAGTMWIDLETAQVVREAYVTYESASEGPPKLPFIGQISFELNQIAIDYALWEGRWWLPSTMSLSGALGIGRLAKATLEYRRVYRGFEVSPVSSAPSDTEVPGLGEQDSASDWVVQIPDKRESLLVPPSMARSIFASNREALGLSAVEDRRSLILDPEVRLRRPDDGPRWEFPRIDLLRYNRIEGQAIGSRVVMTRGGVDFETEAWFATGNPSIRSETSANWGGPRQGWRVEVYDRFGALNRSFSALAPFAGFGVALFGRDYGEFVRQTGAGVRVVADLESRWELGASLRFERQRAVEVVASASLPSLWDRSFVGRPALLADPADQLSLNLSGARRWAPGARSSAATVKVDLDGSVGTFDYARVQGTAVAERWFGAIGVTGEAGGGLAVGSVPLQGLYLLGGPGSVAGYDPGEAAGERFGLVRLEVQVGGRGVAGVLFGHTAWTSSIPLDRGVSAGHISSAGSALVILGGAFRLELSRALDQHREWRLGMTGELR